MVGAVPPLRGTLYDGGHLSSHVCADPERAPRGVNANADRGLGAVACPRRSVSCDKGRGDASVGGGRAMSEGRVRENLCFPLGFEITLKLL